jgi:hypothetical protein
MKLTAKVAALRQRLIGRGVPPDTIVAGRDAWRELLQEVMAFRIMATRGLEKYEDMMEREALPVAELRLFDMIVHESLTAPPDAIYVGVGLKP